MNKQELVYKEIKRLILTGELKPNMFLSERNISDRLGVSRTPVRAALNDLCNDNLIIFYQGRGMMVAGISPEDIREVYQIRDALDVLAVQAVMEIGNTAVIDEMNGHMENMIRAAAEGNWEEVLSEDRLFHESYVCGTSNARLRGILTSLSDQINRFMNTIIYDVGRLRESVREHEEIMEAVNSGDIGKMQEALRNHLRISRDYHLRNVMTASHP